MSNKFKVGDKIVITCVNARALQCAKDTTAGNTYTLLEIDTLECNAAEPHDVVFIDDVGDRVTLFPEHITLA